MEQYIVTLVLGSVAAIAISRLLQVLLSLTWRVHVIANWYRKQGLQGPEYKFLKGSVDEMKQLMRSGQEVPMDIASHDFTPRVFPHYLRWMSLYGRTFLFWIGSKPRICITDMELAKQVLLNKSGFYKADAQPALLSLLGKGLLLLDGSDWARHKRVVNPAFNIDKLKAMSRKMTDCAKSMIEGWENQIAVDKSKQIEMELNSQFRELTADVISHTAFGSSYMKGKEVFCIQKELQVLAFASFLNVGIPGFQHLPTANNRKRWGLEKRVRTILTQIIRERMESARGGEYGNDLLGLMLAKCMDDDGQEKDGNRLSMDEIIDECKTFYFAGHEMTSHLLTWTMFLLSTNQDWQEKLREEVLNVCGMETPNSDMLSKLKLVNMVLLEALRIYGPVGAVVRKASHDIELGTIKLLKGTSMVIPIAILHRDKEIWGSDANEFNPLRFENGLSKAAKHPNALLSFSIGPRACIGQNFALLEAKAVVAMILQKFSFSISPSYKHQPIEIILQPKSGLQVIINPLQN